MTAVIRYQYNYKDCSGLSDMDGHLPSYGETWISNRHFFANLISGSWRRELPWVEVHKYELRLQLVPWQWSWITRFLGEICTAAPVSGHGRQWPPSCWSGCIRSSPSWSSSFLHWATDSPLIGEMVIDIFLQPYIACVFFAILRESLDHNRDIALIWDTLLDTRIKMLHVDFLPDLDSQSHWYWSWLERNPILAISSLNLSCQKQWTSPGTTTTEQSPILFRAPLLHEARSYSDSRMFNLASSLLFQTPHGMCTEKRWTQSTLKASLSSELSATITSFLKFKSSFKRNCPWLQNYECYELSVWYYRIGWRRVERVSLCSKKETGLMVKISIVVSY